MIGGDDQRVLEMVSSCSPVVWGAREGNAELRYCQHFTHCGRSERKPVRGGTSYMPFGPQLTPGLLGVEYGTIFTWILLGGSFPQLVGPGTSPRFGYKIQLLRQSFDEKLMSTLSNQEGQLWRTNMNQYEPMRHEDHEIFGSLISPDLTLKFAPWEWSNGLVWWKSCCAVNGGPMEQYPTPNHHQNHHHSSVCQMVWLINNDQYKSLLAIIKPWFFPVDALPSKLRVMDRS